MRSLQLLVFLTLTALTACKQVIPVVEPECVPKTCEELQGTCGTQFDDGCGGTGTCAACLVSPSILTQPSSVTALVGTAATFSVTVAGQPTPTLQWQRSVDNGATFANITGATELSYVISAAVLADDGSRFRVVATNGAGSVNSDAAILNVTATATPPVFTVNPASVTVAPGTSPTFTVSAIGVPAPTLQWQTSTAGGTFANLPGQTSDTYTATSVALTDTGRQFRVVASNSAGTEESLVATLTVTASQVAPTFATQPRNATVTAPQPGTFTVSVSGAPTPTLQWESSADGTVWAPVAGATSSSYTTPATSLADTGTQFRVVATNPAGTAISAEATLIVRPGSNAPAFVTQPVSVAVTAPSTATFQAVATGTPTPTIRWQSGMGGTFTDIVGANGTTYTTPATTPALSGTQYRAVATNSVGSTNSSAATLTVVAPSSACAPGGVPITCSGQGTCSVNAGTAVCTCNAGFIAQGLNCVSGTDPCLNQTCDGRGTCGLFGGVAKCACNPPFVQYNNLRCGTEQEAYCPPGSCSGHGTCTFRGIVGGTPRSECACDPGYQPIGTWTGTPAPPPMQCINPCAGQTCSGHGTCYYQPAAPGRPEAVRCACDPSYTPTGTLQCTTACGGTCTTSQYCDVAAMPNVCRSLPADGVQYGLLGSNTSFRAITSNSAGDIYVAGSYATAIGVAGNPGNQAHQALLVKYNANKVKQWERVWGPLQSGPGSVRTIAQAITQDSAGNVYTAGYFNIRQAGTNPNVLVGSGEVVKWDSAGNRLWGFQYPLTTEAGAPTGSAVGVAVGPAPDFPIYVVGSVWGRFNGMGTAGSLSDAMVMKINSAGTGSIAWTKVFGPTGDNNQDKATGVAVDAAGDVYVTGTVAGNINGVTGTTGGACNFLGCGGSMVTCNDAFVAKWNPAGVHQWTRYRGVANQADSGQSIAIANGAVHVSGTIASGGYNYRPFVWKLDTAGVTAWSREMPVSAIAGSNNAITYFYGVAADATGRVFVTGISQTDYDGQTNKNRTGATGDVLLTSWDSAGNKLSSRLVGSDDPTMSEGGLDLAIGGNPLKVYLVGNRAKNLTEERSSASFVIYANP